MTTALVVLAACFVWVSALATWSLNRQISTLIDRQDAREEKVRREALEDTHVLLAQMQEQTGTLAEELTANRGAFEETLRMVVAHSERMTYGPTPAEPAPTSPPWPLGPPPGPLPNRADLPPEVTGDFDVDPQDVDPGFLAQPLDHLVREALDDLAAQIGVPEPMPEVDGAHPAAVYIDNPDDPDPMGIGAHLRDDTP